LISKTVSGTKSLQTQIWLRTSQEEQKDGHREPDPKGHFAPPPGIADLVMSAHRAQRDWLGELFLGRFIVQKFLVKRG
jgi:hypothetical protein